MSRPLAISRVMDVLAFALGACLVAGMARMAFTLSTWPFRLLAAATAVYVAYRLALVARSLRRSGWPPDHGVTKHLL